MSIKSDRWIEKMALEHGMVAGPTGRMVAESFHTRWTG